MREGEEGQLSENISDAESAAPGVHEKEGECKGGVWYNAYLSG